MVYDVMQTQRGVSVGHVYARAGEKNMVGEQQTILDCAASQIVLAGRRCGSPKLRVVDQ